MQVPPGSVVGMVATGRAAWRLERGVQAGLALVVALLVFGWILVPAGHRLRLPPCSWRTR